jgi:hypothetical protein
MGIPYSKQINSAFHQVTPLVSEGFRVLQTIRDIAVLVAVIQLFAFFFLGWISLAALGLLVTLNPDLEAERQAFVTPAVKWFSSWLLDPEYRVVLGMGVLAVVGGTVAGTWAGLCLMRDPVLVRDDQNGVQEPQPVS